MLNRSGDNRYDLAEAERHLKLIDPNATQFEFRTFDDDKKRKDKSLIHTFYGTLAQHAANLQRLNSKGAGVFFTINETDGKGRKAANIIRVRAVFADLDGAPLEPVMQGKLPPHIIIKSSPEKFHVYWCVDGMALDDFAPVQKAIITRFNSDPSIHDLPRVMRLAGFCHCKGEPFLIRIVSTHDAPAYPAVNFKANGKDNGIDPFTEHGESISGKWRELNDTALENLKKWVPDLFPDLDLTQRDDGGYRITSKQLDRDLEEDLAITAGGIKDFGVWDMGDEREGKRTPIDLVMEYGHPDFNDAVAWLRERLGLETKQPEPEIEIEVELEPEPESAAPPPANVKEYIVMKGGKLVPISKQAEAALIKSGARICQRKAHLVRPVRYRDIRTEQQLANEAKDKNAIHRDHNSIVLQVIDKPQQLLGPMSTACPWYRQVKDGKDDDSKQKYKLVAADPDPKYATEILNHIGEWKFPVLIGVIAAPTLDRQGNIIEKPGYDESSGLLLDFKAGDFAPVPINPSKEDALAAMAKINRPLRGFPFDGENANVKKSPSRSVILSAILTATIRPVLNIVPLHGISSPMAGTGKSMLSKIPGLIATGTLATALNQGPTPEEDEKRLSVSMNEGDNIINLDNCDRPITGSFLCQMLTEPQVQARILGLSERRLLPNNTLVIANGNNLIFMADTVRRSLSCRLNADVEHPEDRVFDFSALNEVRQQRHELLIAALTILRAFKIAKPDIKLKPMGDYTDYSEWIRGALMWLTGSRCCHD
jgi:DNA primase RepB-like protein